MKRYAKLLLTTSSIALASCAAACSPPPPVVTTVNLLCTQTSRYHTTDAQRAAAHATPDLWDSLFRWLAAFDAERDKNCPT